MLEGRGAPPAKADDGVSWARSGEPHPVLSDRVELADEATPLVDSDRVWVAGELARQEVRRDGDEAICRELVGNAANPAGEAEDLVDHDDDGGAVAPLRVHHPRAHAVA